MGLAFDSCGRARAGGFGSRSLRCCPGNGRRLERGLFEVFPPAGQPGPLPHHARCRKGISGKRPGHNHQPRARSGAVRHRLPVATGRWLNPVPERFRAGCRLVGDFRLPTQTCRPARCVNQRVDLPVPDRAGTIRPGRGIKSETPTRSGAESVESGVVLVDTPELALTANADAKIVEAILESTAHFTDKADRIA